jgi:arginine decarboxylase-like protein
VGTRQCEDVDWDGRGHRSLVNTELGIIYRFMYPGMVSVRQMKELVQHLLQSNQQMQHGYEAMKYMKMQVIISTSICQIPIIIKTEDLVINE